MKESAKLLKLLEEKDKRIEAANEARLQEYL
jgi:hypothetical protein